MTAAYRRAAARKYASADFVRLVGTVAGDHNGDWIELTLPVPPSLNNAFVNSADGGRHKSARYIAWRNAAHLALIAQGKPPRIAGPIAVALEFPAAMRGDLDNRIKPVLDFLVVHGLIGDDRNVDWLQAKRENRDNVRVVVTRRG